MIDVKIFATLRDGREKAYQLPAEDYHCPADIMKYLDIPVDEVAILLINGFHSKPEDPIKDGDMVSLFPPCAGG